MKDFIKLYLGTLRRVLHTMTIGAAGRDGRSGLLRLYNSFKEPDDGSVFPVDPYIIPKTDILAINGDDQAVYSGVEECGFGHITEFELKVICQIVRKSHPSVIFEIGTFEGRTTLNMALNAPGARIYTLDLPAAELNSTQMKIEKGEEAYVKKARSGERFLHHPAGAGIQQLYGDSAAFDFSSFYDQVDLMFIDGSHAYDYVISDTEKALKMVRKGGVILWHDYTNWEGVREALNEFYREKPGFRELKHIGGTSIVMMTV